MDAPRVLGAPKFTRLSKVVSGVILIVCLITWIAPATREYVALVPGRTLPCVWNLVTSSFVTPNPLKAAAEVAALLLLARVVEPIYGSTELARLLVLVAACCGGATFVGAYLAYLFSPEKDGSVLYSQFYGFHGVVGGLLVGFKQILGDQDLKLGGVLRLEARFVPTLYVLAGAVLAVLLGAWTALPFLFAGPYSAWVYLRFFQRQPETTLKGDPSEDFRFSSFFPEAMQPPIDAAARVCGTALFLRHDAAANSGSGSEGRALLGSRGAAAGAPLGGDSLDASRRRERGVRALEERLMMAAGKGGSGGTGAAVAAAAAGPEAADKMETGSVGAA